MNATIAIVSKLDKTRDPLDIFDDSWLISIEISKGPQDGHLIVTDEVRLVLQYKLSLGVHIFRMRLPYLFY